MESASAVRKIPLDRLVLSPANPSKHSGLGYRSPITYEADMQAAMTTT